MTDFLTLDDGTFAHKTVIVRADMNVPTQNGVVTDASRLVRMLPTLQFLAAQKAKVVVLSHFGRPDGKPNAKYSLRPIAAELAKHLGQPVAFGDDCIGTKAEAAISSINEGQIVVLENTRFHPEEEENDPAFAQQLARLGDAFVHDAFSAAHRAHASTEGIAHYLPSYAGRLMQAELEALHRALAKPERPVAAIVGGSKISTKLDLLNNLISKVDKLVLGGGMANTFLAARGIAIGKSLSEPNMYDTARQIQAMADARGCTIILPHDVVIADSLSENAATESVAIDAVPADKMILDIGYASIKAIGAELATCKTIVWNGPLGAFEISPFDVGTTQVAKIVADLTERGVVLSVAGGGDTVSALIHAGVADKLSYLSGAGGAFLEWLEGKTLPGVAALKLSASTTSGKASA